jgi:CDP-6-deoxy-D-xylo-4-hexulose-3-dehydrase
MVIQRSHGWLRDVKSLSNWKKLVNFYDYRFVFVDTGYNIRPTELQASIGLIQLRKLDGFIKKRRSNAQWLRKNLQNQISHLVDFQETEKNGYHTWFGFTIILKKHSNLKVPAVRKALRKLNVETRPIICGDICSQPAFKYIKYKSKKNVAAKYIMDRAFSVGIHQSLSNQDLKKIQKSLIKVIKKWWFIVFDNIL